MADITNLSNFLGDVADAIRTKNGTTDTIPASEFDTKILEIETGIDTSDATATSNDIVAGKTAYVNGEKIEGVIPIQEETVITTEGIQETDDDIVTTSTVFTSVVIPENGKIETTTDKTTLTKTIGLTYNKIIIGETILGIKGEVDFTSFDDYDRCLDIAKNINQYSVCDFGKPNIFIQSTEPDNKNGIWIKTDATFDNFYTCDTVVSENGLTNELPASTCYDPNICAINGIIYMFGSSSSSGGTSYRTARKYNPNTNTWTSIASPTAGESDYLACCSYDGLAYVLCGYGTSNGTLYSYNPEKDIYTSLKACSTVYSGRFRCSTMIGYNNVIYMFGANYTGSTGTTIKYDISTKLMTKLASAPVSVCESVATIYNGDAYVVSTDRTSIYKYSIDNNNWTKHMTLPHTYSCACYFIGTKLYVHQGVTCYIYDISTATALGTYTTSISISSPYPSTAVIDNTAYIKTSGISWYNSVFTLLDNEPNSILLDQHNDVHSTLLFAIGSLNSNVRTGFNNIYLTNDSGKIDNSINIYIGNGTEWKYFKGEG